MMQQVERHGGKSRKLVDNILSPHRKQNSMWSQKIKPPSLSSGASFMTFPKSTTMYSNTRAQRGHYIFKTQQAETQKRKSRYSFI